ncbi:MAG TPA: TolC family protein [Flavisolibacter sp.]|jgi:outer membrane protein TolC|nr:TolC family protein [Flavisolibacter sp.]
MKSKFFIIVCSLLLAAAAFSQEKLSIEEVFSSINNNHPDLKGYDAQIRSLDEAAKGAKNWEPPLLSTGLYMTPYNPSLWKKMSDGTKGMGQYMISAEQMFPNKKMLNAEQKYMQSMSTVETEKKNATINELYAQAKKNYYQWIIVKKKINVLDQDMKILDFMIKDAELRYKNNLGKISAYYKAKASVGNIETMKVMLENEMVQRRIALNTLMNRDKNMAFDIDTNYVIKDYSSLQFDSTAFINSRSDIKAVEREIQIVGLQQDVERTKLKPEFGMRFDHMFGFGGVPMQYSLMGMVRLPMTKWSSRAAIANVQSLKWKAESLNQERLGMINEASGMAAGMKNEILARQRQIKLYEDNIIPALRKNFQTMQIAYQNNTEELFELYDAWETLNMTQLQYLDQLNELLQMQAELERILEIK